jgi:hypothetical protein
MNINDCFTTSVKQSGLVASEITGPNNIFLKESVPTVELWQKDPRGMKNLRDDKMYDLAVGLEFGNISFVRKNT